MTSRIMIVEARFYEDIADLMMESVKAELDDAGATYECFRVPGAFELPGAIRMAIGAQENLYAIDYQDDYAKASNDTQVGLLDGYHGYIALGCVIRGETTHYDYVCQESARGLNDLVLRYGVALGYGVITAENKEQALARARRDRHDRAGAAARACLAMIEIKRRLTGKFPNG